MVLVMLEDGDLGKAGEIVEAEPQTALQLIEAGVARAHMGAEEHKADRYPKLPDKEEF